MEHTVRLSTVDPTNSIDLYVAPDTDISPIICVNEYHKEWDISVTKRESLREEEF